MVKIPPIANPQNVKINGTEVLELIELDLSLLEESYGIHQGATDFPFYTMLINRYGEHWKCMNE